MKKIIIIILILYIIGYSFHYKEITEIETRADYIISLMESFYDKNGAYPKDIDDILPDTYNTDNMMVNSNVIPGKGTFIIFDARNKNYVEYILVVGGWYPPNVIYYPNLGRKELNSDYFSRMGL